MAAVLGRARAKSSGSAQASASSPCVGRRTVAAVRMSETLVLLGVRGRQAAGVLPQPLLRTQAAARWTAGKGLGSHVTEVARG
jgi:hypothetical protein